MNHEDALEDGRYRTHGIDQVPPLVRRGVLFDVPRDRECLPQGEPVGVDELRAAGPTPHPETSPWSAPAGHGTETTLQPVSVTRAGFPVSRSRRRGERRT